MTDNELVDAYHAARCSHDASRACSPGRVEAFIHLASAEAALVHRLGAETSLRRYRDRYPDQVAPSEAEGGRSSLIRRAPILGK